MRIQVEAQLSRDDGRDDSGGEIIERSSFKHHVIAVSSSCIVGYFASAGLKVLDMKEHGFLTPL
jgi:hypothetical protein